MIQHQGPISGIAAYKSELVATAGYDNRLILWDARDKRPLARASHDHLANQCAFSRDGRWLVSSSSDHTARLWELPALKLRAVLADHLDDVEMSAIHATKPLIATASRDHRVRVYDFDGRLLHRLEGHKADVISVDWVQGKDEIVSSSDDGTVKRWSAATGELLSDFGMEGVETDTLAVSTDGTIYAGNDQGEIVIIAGGAAARVQAHEAGIKRLVLDSERGVLVSLSYDRTFKIWRAEGGALALVASASLPQVVWPRSCAFLGDSSLVFGTFGSSYASYDYKAERWDLSRIEGTPCVNAVLARPDGVLTVGDAGVVRRDGLPLSEPGSLCNFLVSVGPLVVAGGQSGQLFDAATGRVLHQHRSPLNCGAAFEKDGETYVVIGAYTGEGLVFRLTDGGGLEHAATVALHANAIKGVAASAGVIFSVCADASAAFHSASDFSELERLPGAHRKIANGCAALPGGVFASVSRDLTLRLWRGFRSETIPTPHTHSIKCVAASPDGRFVATGSYNGRVAVFDALERRWTKVERPTNAGISSLTHDGAGFLAGSYDGRVHRIEP